MARKKTVGSKNAPPAPEQITVGDMLTRWDGGESIWSIEMGGLGPGYEQAIQVLIVELVRDGMGKVLPLPESKEAETWGDDTVRRLSHNGFSGAQVGAAKHVAYKMLRDGYSETLDSMRAHDNDRLILVSNQWPRAQAVPA